MMVTLLFRGAEVSRTQPRRSHGVLFQPPEVLPSWFALLDKGTNLASAGVNYEGSLKGQVSANLPGP